MFIEVEDLLNREVRKSETGKTYAWLVIILGVMTAIDVVLDWNTVSEISLKYVYEIARKFSFVGGLYFFFIHPSRLAGIKTINGYVEFYTCNLLDLKSKTKKVKIDSIIRADVSGGKLLVTTNEKTYKFRLSLFYEYDFLDQKDNLMNAQ